MPYDVLLYARGKNIGTDVIWRPKCMEKVTTAGTDSVNLSTRRHMQSVTGQVAIFTYGYYTHFRKKVDPNSNIRVTLWMPD